jgi:hypothetical protein
LYSFFGKKKDGEVREVGKVFKKNVVEICFDIFISTVTVASPKRRFSTQSIMSRQRRSKETCDRIFFRINGFCQQEKPKFKVTLMPVGFA